MNNKQKKVVQQEALRVTGDVFLRVRGSCYTFLSPQRKDAPQLVSRQSARFELLDSQSLVGLTTTDYLGKHVFVTEGRKLIFGRAFSRHCDGTLNEIRYMLPKNIISALEEIMGKPLSVKQEKFLEDIVGKILEPVDFRKWCGICAVVERLLSYLSPRELDPPTWIEKTDFEALEQRLKLVIIDSRLASLLYLIRDR